MGLEAHQDFIDDYFNCLTVGSVMRPVTDRHQVSRAKLAYLIDATAAPICIIAPISSWAAAVSAFAPEGTNGLVLFIRAIPYNYYALFTLVMMITLTVLKIEYGPMLKYEKNAMKQMSEHFLNDGTITLKEFLSIYRENYKPENNFLLQIGLNDWVWFKSHLKDSVYLNKTSELEKYEFMFTKIKVIRQDADPGVVVNFIKSIYAMYQNRDTLFEESLQTNVDLIFDSIYRYLKEEC